MLDLKICIAFVSLSKPQILGNTLDYYPLQTNFIPPENGQMFLLLVKQNRTPNCKFHILFTSPGFFLEFIQASATDLQEK